MARISLVTGSSKGIGKAIAETLLKDGQFVYITYLTDHKGAEELHEKYPDNSDVLSLDVRLESSVKDVISHIKKEKGVLDILVNNAAVEIPGDIQSISLKEWKSVIDVKLDGIFLMSKYALDLLKKSESGNIVNISSKLGTDPYIGSPAYSVANAGVDALTKLLALDYAQYGIRTNSIIPTPINTNMWRYMGADDKAMWDEFAESNPMHRLTTAEDVGEAVLMLCNDKTGFINGNTIYVTGGGHLA